MHRQVATIVGLASTGPCAQQWRLVLQYAPQVDLHAKVSGATVSGERATVKVSTIAGVGRLQLVREGRAWKISAPGRTVVEYWRRLVYRVGRSPSTRVLADALAARASAMLGRPAFARALGNDRVVLDVAEPVLPAALARVTNPDVGRLALYDWEADALTPAGRVVAGRLSRHEPAAFAISQGAGTLAPGAVGAGSVPLGDALALASRHAGPDAVVRARHSAAPPGGQYFVLRDRPLLTGADITDPHAGTNGTSEPDVAFGLTPRGAQLFRRETAAIARRGAALSSNSLLVRQHFAVVLDGQLLTVAYVDFRKYPHGIPTRNGIAISGGFTFTTAHQIASSLGPPLPRVRFTLLSSTRFTRAPASR
jgi:hypothetical protein